jgi:hypothetical protein
MPQSRRSKKALGRKSVVQLRVPLAGLERLADLLNEFERNPLQDEGQGVPLEDEKTPSERGFGWLMRFGGIEDAVPLGSPIPPGKSPESVRIVGLGEVMSAIAARLLGDEVMSAHIRRCDTCHRWMATKYTNRQRHRACHSKVFTRAYRNRRRRARERQAATGASQGRKRR